MSRSFAVAVLMCLLSVPAFSDESNWDNLKRLEAGDKIRVIEVDRAAVAGRFVGFTEGGLTLRVAKHDLLIPRDRVYRVTTGGRGRNALIGLALGAAAGVVLGVASPELGQGTASKGHAWMVAK
jgi:hypothetical protein